MKTIYHVYSFDISTPQGRKDWIELQEKLKNHPCCMEAWGVGSFYHEDRDNTEIELDTTHLFNNQWNTKEIPSWGKASGYRVFDWALDACLPNKAIKRGHYLDQTPEMIEIRRNTVCCSYCGKQEPAAKGYKFCPHCLGSEYLRESDLFLTRMAPVCEFGDKLDSLTEAELNHLLPLYREAQLHKHNRDAVELRKKLHEEYANDVENAKSEHDGMIWLLDHGMNIDNVIYYKHTGKFCFGWRKPVDQSVLSALLDIISEFRWPYDIKTHDGRTLSSY